MIQLQNTRSLRTKDMTACSGIFGIRIAHNPLNQCRVLATLYSEDDGMFTPIMEFDPAWLPDLENLAKIAMKLQAPK